MKRSVQDTVGLNIFQSNLQLFVSVFSACLVWLIFSFDIFLFVIYDIYRKYQCTMPLPMSIDILEILKSKRSFLAHFWSKSNYFFSRWRKIVRILGWIFSFIYFVKYLRSYLQKKREGGSDKHEIWHVRQLDHAEKKSLK